MSSMTMSEARARLPEVLNRVALGEEITITRHGQPAAVVLRPDALRSRRTTAVVERSRRIADLLAEARERPLRAGGVTIERANELAAAVQADRDHS